MGGPYREPTLGLQRRLATLVAARAAELEELPPALSRIYSRRVARVVAGMVAFAGMSAVFAVSLGYWASGNRDMRVVGALAVTLWVAVPLAYCVARLVAQRSFAPNLAREFYVSGDIHRDIALLESATAYQRGAEMAEKLERPSAAWPLIGTALLVPILLHWAVYGVHLRAVPGLAELGLWIGLSALTVVHCHYVLAYQAWRYARSLSRAESDQFMDLDNQGLRALGITAASSVLPGAALAGVPCILVVLTGFTFIPISFWSVTRRLRAERMTLAGLTG